MRFPRTIAILATLAATACFAAPDGVRDEIAKRLKEQLKDVPVAEYPLGAAAFDAQLREQVQENATAGAAAMAAGEKLWGTKFKDGRSLSGCFPNAGRRIAATYPQYDSKLKRVITLETAINQCLKSHNEAIYDPTDPATMGAVLAYLRSLADGRKVAVRVPASAQERFEQGRRLYFTRLGQRNFACASCHIQGAGKRYGARVSGNGTWGGDVPLSPAIGQASHWPVIRDGKPVTLQARVRECLELMGAAPFPAGSEELNDIEYFLTYLANDSVMKANVWRGW
jgi:sulfur-oxidizing protein SoxA